jgi:signal transduction histidine kinase
VGTLALSAALAGMLVPSMAPIGEAITRWRQCLWVGTGLLTLLGWIRTASHLRGLGAAGTADVAARRAAHDFPFRLARSFFAAAVLGGLGTFALLRLMLGGTHQALVAGVITYLLLVLPAPLAYLLTRRALRPWAAGPPGAPPVGGVRQTLAMRLAFAVQLPVVVCSVGIVIIEQSNGAAYDRALEDDYRETYVRIAQRVARHLPEDAVAAMGAVSRPEGVAWSAEGWVALPAEQTRQRPLDLRLPPLVLLAAVLLLAGLLGRWLAREVTRDVAATHLALAEAGAGDLDATALRAAAPGPLGLRETTRLFDAFDAALEGLHAQQTALAAATRRRRDAEQAKNRFLAHLSHELKSPLNSILGFTELLLAELEGPLSPQQKRSLAILWRAGDSLLRFILALLDLARLEVPLLSEVTHARPSGLDARPCSLVRLAAALSDQLRPDPNGALEVRVQVDHPTAKATADVTHTARALMLLAGLLTDLLDEGVVMIRMTAAGSELRMTVAVLGGDPDPTALARLNRHVALSTDAPQQLDPATGEYDGPTSLSGGAPVPGSAFGAPGTVWRLARWVFEAQGGGLVAEAGVFLGWLPAVARDET